METSFYQPDHYRLTKRVLLHQHTIQQHKLNINDTVIIKPHNQQQQPNTTTIHFAIGTIWPSSSNHHHHHSKDIVALSFDHLLNAAILPGQHVSITPLPPTNHTTPGRGGILQLPEAKEITLKHIHLTSLSEPYQQLLLSSQEETQLSQLNTQNNNNNNRLWEAFIREVLVDRKYLAINHHISIPFANATRIFLIQDIQPLDPKHSPQAIELFLITRQTRLKVIPPSSSSSDQPPAPPTTDHHQLSYDAIGGLDLQVQQIRELVELPLTRPELYSHFDLTPPKGILLYGPPGTGKTLLASIIAKSTNSTLLTLSTATISSAYHGEAEQNIYEIFREAKAKAPSIIVIDEIDGLFPNREEGGDVDRRMVGALLTCMDGMDQKTVSPASLDAPRVMVVATTNRPHTLDPALRRPGRFDREIEIGIPDACGRHKILEVMLRKMPHQLTAEETKKIAERTHGFVGADLLALVREAGLRAIKRSLASSIRTEEMRLEPDDITQALLTVRPSAMRELHIETPRVTWADIGGQREVKQRLVETLSWPSKYPDTFDRLGIRPIRGILLYGPPGCSKTLIAKALASESDMNFIAIKGSDVFNKFLGESEKAIRDLFRKARAASPSTIFIGLR